ncbi:MAG: UDP-N-acetylenolpyruvoylglucosamine reductase [Myxococcota bacterium]|nr:UDP-N-acetylenolpyruvoylglucosamine reductase [Myxococcota bacterium]
MEVSEQVRMALTGVSAGVRWLEPLSAHTALRAGGPAEVFVRADNPDQLRDVLKRARTAGAPVLILGGGSNVLVSDAGVRGVTLVLRGEFERIQISDDLVIAGAAARNAAVVAEALRAGLVGLEFLAGIPGVIGGAVKMNAGAHGGELSDVLRFCEVMTPDGRQSRLTSGELGLAYRQSALPSGSVVMSAELRLPTGDVEASRARIRELKAKRRATQPLNFPNAGSIFKNPPGDFAGRLIESAGLKGMAIGGAMVSPLHANFIVNTGGASASDIFELAERVRRLVQERTGVRLEYEVKLLGEFPGHPAMGETA